MAFYSFWQLVDNQQKINFAEKLVGNAHIEASLLANLGTHEKN